MASKVLVKIPVAPFGHVNKGGKTPSGNPNDVSSSSTSTPTSVTAEIVTVGTSGASRCTDPLLRIAQLEQNIRFLQEQHAQMLAGLHQEIDTLRQRNRDLQFQLVFSKGQIATPNSASPSSPEEDSKNRVLSPRQVNITPLQVELLEREIGELKITLNEVNTKNAYLTAIVDEQKKKLERINQDNSTVVSVPPDPELISKLDDVESLVRKLRRENDDLRREVSDMRSQPPQPPQSQAPLQLQLQNNGQNQQFQHQQHRGGRHRGGHYRGHRFPPLHTQSYWQGGRSQDKDDGTSAGTSLPSLNMNGGQPLQHHQQQQHGGGGAGGPPHHNGHGGHGHGHGHGHGGHYSGGKRSGGSNHNNHQYHQGGNGNGNPNGNGGKYRGSQSRGHKS